MNITLLNPDCALPRLSPENTTQKYHRAGFLHPLRGPLVLAAEIALESLQPTMEFFVSQPAAFCRLKACSLRTVEGRSLGASS
jgi:hypothetical protein